MAVGMVRLLEAVVCGVVVDICGWDKPIVYDSMLPPLVILTLTIPWGE